MAVTVQIPCRLRVDPESVGVDDLMAAFRSALDRAVERATRAVVAPRGAKPALAPEAPAFRWTGPAVDRVSAAGRLALERRLDAAIEEAVATAGRIAGTGEEHDPDEDAPAGRRLAEPIERGRTDPLLRTYQMPSYQGGGADADIAFEDDPLTARPPVRHDWRIVVRPRTRAQVAALAREAIRQFGPLPSTAPRGLIARERTRGGRLAWTVFIDTQPATVFGVPAFGDYVYRPATHDFVERPGDPPAVAGTAERRSLAGPNGLIAVVDELMGEDIRADVERARPRGETMTVDEYAVLVDRAVDDEVARRVDGVLAGLHGAAPTGVVIVRLGSSFAILVTTAADDANLHWTGTANLLPIAVEVPTGDGREPATGGVRAPGTRGGGAPGTGGRGAPGTGGRGEPGIGDGRRRGGFVFDPGGRRTDAERKGRRFPVVRHDGETMSCQSFQGEPDVAALGTDGEPLRQLIDDIAFRLQIAPCYFAANFCLMAAQALRTRARDISTYIASTEPQGSTQPVRDGTGDLGPLRIHPVASPAIQFLRHLAGVVPRLHSLALTVMRTYESPAHWPRVRGGWIDSPASWNLHFLEEFTPRVEYAVGEIFVSASQAMLLQLLLAAKRGIDARIANFERYAPIFERLMVSQLSDYAELQRLRDRLRRHEAARWVQQTTDRAGGDVTAALAATNPATAWFGSARALSAVLLASDAATSPGTAGEIVETNGVARIRDSHGVMWSVTDIEQALVMRRGEAEGIDPLVKQITEVPNVLERFARNRTAIRAELWRVLGEMRTNNAEMLGKARADAWFAFRSSRIADDIPSDIVPGSAYPLQGIHLQVHRQLGEFFGGDPYYALGINFLFGSEKGRQALTEFGILVGITLICVLCPPLGFVAGVVTAAGEVAHAHERERLYGALIDPELVLTRAEVEVELFAAYLGLALSLIPEAPTVLGAARQGIRVGLRAGLRAGARSAGRYVVRRAVRQMMQALARDLVTEFITQILVAEVMERVIRKVMEPILAHIEREEMIRGAVGGTEGAAFVLMVLDPQRPAGAAVTGSSATVTATGSAGTP